MNINLNHIAIDAIDGMIREMSAFADNMELLSVKSPPMLHIARDTARTINRYISDILTQGVQSLHGLQQSTLIDAAADIFEINELLSYINSCLVSSSSNPTSDMFMNAISCVKRVFIELGFLSED